MNDWQRVGLDGPTSDVIAIKRAYALTLRTTRPDDDAAAYQALREAFDRLLQAARRAVHPDGDAAVVVAEPAKPAAPRPEVEPALPTWVPPEALCAHVVLTVRDHGEAAAIALLPDLTRQLNLLPLRAQQEASVRFADVAIQVNEIPVRLVMAWRDHFGWADRDFRLERLMGRPRMEALARALSNLNEPVTDPAFLAQFDEVMRLHRVIRSGDWMRALLVGALRDEVIRAQWTLLETMLRMPEQQRPPATAGRDLLGGLGISRVDHRRVHEALSGGRAMRAMALLAALVAAALLQGSPILLAIFTAASAMTMGAVAVLGAASVLGAAQRFRASTESAVDKWRTFARPSRPRRSAAWGAGILLLCAAGMAASGPLEVDALYWGSAALALLGVVLALPDTIEEGLVATGFLAYAYLISGGLPVPAMVLLVAWVLAGSRLWRRGTFLRWLDTLASERRRAAPWRAVRSFAAATVVAVPVAVAWVTQRLGDRLALWCMLVAFLLQLRMPTALLPMGGRLLLLPACLAAGWGARALAARLGDWLAARWAA
ncbi:hypothetical protein [Rhizobacter sp. Root1221]|uniref:hypothetical protein n=1 Tax=Rhizobacter sp. Root1221 TaxID=1736433 RepID=UPI0006F37D54|nr:hypothetical protein [Rhizobacter sp. Root1221]KQW00279.1 hypothetical protein ASC87_18565 [Rhizobacter sp. Root1221]